MKLKEYNSLVEKSKWFNKHININTIDEVDSLLAEIPELNNTRKVFRGSGEAKYKIYTSAQRMWIINELKHRFPSYKSFLKKLVREFEYSNPVIGKFFKKVGIPTDEIPLFAYMQHYGAPSPFIDFTRNANVALFFAIDGLTHFPSEDINNYFSFYILDEVDTVSFQKVYAEKLTGIYKTLDKTERTKYNLSEESIKKGLEELKELTEKDLRKLDNFIDFGPEIISETEIQNVKYYTESNLNILNQEGLFVVNTLAYTPLEEAFDISKLLFAIKDKKGAVTKDNGEYNLQKSIDIFFDKTGLKIFNFLTCYNIHKSFKTYITEYLNLKGITSDYIYPNTKKMVERTVKNTLK